MHSSLCRLTADVGPLCWLHALLHAYMGKIWTAFMQHASVYTLGKRGQTAHFKVPKANLEQQGIDIHNAGRGGETTYHGPGQLVLYPIVNLRRLGLGARAYVESLEECMVGACGHYGIHARVRVQHWHLKQTSCMSHAHLHRGTHLMLRVKYQAGLVSGWRTEKLEQWVSRYHRALPHMELQST